jgi:hypothetical protein
LVDGPIDLFLGDVFGKKIAAHGGRIAATNRAPHHPCANPRPLPKRLSPYQRVTLTRAASLDCTSFFAAQLFLHDGGGRIAAVNLVLAEP